MNSSTLQDHHHYAAELCVDDEQFATKTGDDLDKLESWMHAMAAEMFGNLSGSIIDQKKRKPLKSFRVTPV